MIHPTKEADADCRWVVQPNRLLACFDPADAEFAALNVPAGLVSALFIERGDAATAVAAMLRGVVADETCAGWRECVAAVAKRWGQDRADEAEVAGYAFWFRAGGPT